MTQEIIERLGLEPHPEGGWLKRTYESSLAADVEGCLRPLGTAAYYYLQSSEYSSWHRISSDEMLHYYEGSSVTVHMLDTEGNMSHVVLGKLSFTARPQVLVPAGTWFALEVDCQNSYTLLGCTVTPGFSFDDFELAGKKLAEEYPQHRDIILRLIREK